MRPVRKESLIACASCACDAGRLRDGELGSTRLESVVYLTTTSRSVSLTRCFLKIVEDNSTVLLQASRRRQGGRADSCFSTLRATRKLITAAKRWCFVTSKVKIVLTSSPTSSTSKAKPCHSPARQGHEKPTTGLRLLCTVQKSWGRVLRSNSFTAQRFTSSEPLVFRIRARKLGAQELRTALSRQSK